LEHTEGFTFFSSGGQGRHIGHPLFTAQEGKTDPAAKPLKGFGGASVLEIVASHHGNAWRRLYGAFSGCHLCFACISEEVHERHSYTDEGD
jgi:hypothetical protein